MDVYDVHRETSYGCPLDYAVLFEYGHWKFPSFVHHLLSKLEGLGYGAQGYADNVVITISGKYSTTIP